MIHALKFLFFAVVSGAVDSRNMKNGTPVQQAHFPGRGVTERVQMELLENRLAQYNRKMSPNDTVEVGVSMFIDTMSSISEVSMDYDTTIFFRQYWKDARLAWGSGNGSEQLTRADGIYSVHWSLIEHMWTPDLFFVDEKDSKRHEIFQRNALLEIRPDGDILFSERLSVKIGCDMHLGQFPFDNQLCPVLIESYAMRESQLRIYWYKDDEKTSPIKMATEISESLPSYSITGCKIKTNCKQDYVTGQFSCLAGYFYLTRHLSFYVVHLFVPSTLCVLISWLTFWIKLEIAPARVTLGITTFMAIIIETQYFNQEMPKVSYVKAIDIWMFACNAFVFLSIFEYCVAHIYLKKETKEKKLREREQQREEESNARMQKYLHSDHTSKTSLQQSNGVHSVLKRGLKEHQKPTNVPSLTITDDTCNSFPAPRFAARRSMSVTSHQFTELLERMEMNNPTHSGYIDRMSRKIFPISFLAFCLIYFVTCALQSDNFEARFSDMEDVRCLD